MNIKKASVKKGMGYVVKSVVVAALYLGAVAGMAIGSSGCVEFAYANKVHFKTQAPTMVTKWFNYSQPVIVSGEVVNTGQDGEGKAMAEASKAQSIAQSEADAKEVEVRIARIKAENNTLLVRLQQEKKQRFEHEKKNKRSFATFAGRNN